MAAAASFATWVYVPSLFHYFPPLTSFLLTDGSVIQMIGVAEGAIFCGRRQAADSTVLQTNGAAEQDQHNQQGNASRQSLLTYRFIPFANVERNFTIQDIYQQQLEGCNELVLDLLRVVIVQIAEIRSVAIVLHADVYTTKYKHINVAGMDNFFVYQFDSVGNLLEADTLQPTPFPAVPVLGVTAASPTDLIWSSIAAVIDQIRHMLGKVSAQQGRYARASERLRVPPVAWFYIRHHTQPPCVVHSVVTTHTRPFIGSRMTRHPGRILFLSRILSPVPRSITNAK
jgi:hypothetical protein